MKGMLVVTTIAAGATILGGATVTKNEMRSRRVERIDFDRTVTATSPTYNAALPSVSDAGIKEFRIPIKNATIAR